MHLIRKMYSAIAFLKSLPYHPGDDGLTSCTNIWLEVHIFLPENAFHKVANLNSRGAISTTLEELKKQGKSEGFESCDRPIVRKRSIWIKIGDILYRVTLKFDGWHWKTIGHLSFAVSSFVQHFIAIGEFKLELQSGNAQFGSNSTIFRANHIATLKARK